LYDKRFKELSLLNKQLDKTVKRINFSDVDSLKIKTIAQDIQTDCAISNIEKW